VCTRWVRARGGIDFYSLLKIGCFLETMVTLVDVSRTDPGFSNNVMTYRLPPLVSGRTRVNSSDLLGV